MTNYVALVDDEETIVMSLQLALESEGYRIAGFTKSEEALPKILAGEFDAAILDISMPRIDGIEMLMKIRQKSNMPIIMLTSKDHEIDEMMGLHMGADDYIKKPFSMRLLLARLHTCLRRHAAVQAKENTTDKIIKIGELTLNIERHSCQYSEKSINLTVTEFILLQALVDRPGHVRSRVQLMDAAYGDNIHVDDRTVDSHIKRIRSKIRETDNTFDLIETIYGVGYRYQG